MLAAAAASHAHLLGSVSSHVCLTVTRSGVDTARDGSAILSVWRGAFTGHDDKCPPNKPGIVMFFCVRKFLHY